MTQQFLHNSSPKKQQINPELWRNTSVGHEGRTVTGEGDDADIILMHVVPKIGVGSFLGGTELLKDIGARHEYFV